MISVIMPAYNAAAFIGEAIESVLNQTFPDWELIVIDDGSSDDTVDIVEAYISKDSRVRLIRNEHGGISKARNAGIQAARYPWIAILDSDDIAVPERLEKLVAAAEADPEVIIWGCDLHQINSNNEVIGTIQTGPTSKEEFFALDRTKTHIAIQNAMFRRDIALRVGGYNEQMVAGVESELWDRMTEYGPAVVIPEPLVRYRYHPQSISATKFFDQQLFLGFPPARQRAKAEGKTLTLDAYIASFRQQSLFRRLGRRIDLTGRLYYRRAGLKLVEKKKLQAALFLLVAALLSPAFTLTRVAHRVTHKRYD